MSTVAHPQAKTAPNQLFARNATGLVREISPASAFWMQFLGEHPTQPLAYGLFFAFALFPGGNFLIGGLLAIPLVLAYAYSFGLLTSILPRTGGDYLFVSRIISPTVGLISSFCQVAALLTSLAFFGTAVVTLGLAPGLIGIGLVSHNSDLVSWGTTIGTSNTWIFIIGTVLFLLASLMLAGGWRWTLRLQTAILILTSLGLLTCGVVALLMSHTAFVSGFNTFAQPYTNLPDSYAATIQAAQKAGVDTNPSFSFGNTIPITGVLAATAIYSWFASYAGGELRRGRSATQAHMMALSGTVAILVVLVFAWIFINTFGNDFLIAANAGGVGLPQGITASPTYFFLIAAAVGNTPLAVFVVVTYLLFWIGISYYVIMPVTRSLFAYAFDGLLPRVVTEVDGRTHTPWWAIGIAFLLTELFFVWSLRINNFVQVLTYAVLIQLISMSLVGLAAAIVPWRKPDLYRAGATQSRVLGIPVLAIAGVGAVLSGVFIYFLYFHYPAQFGLTDNTQFLLYVLIPIGGAVVFYNAVKLVKRGQGVRQELVYAEIPPE